MSDEYRQHTYTTDDRDFTGNDLTQLIVAWSPNGDFYIGSQIKNKGSRQLVRICNSGGAASRNPRLRQAVQDLFQALGGWGETLPDGTEDQAK
jgi:hypothetical protein